MFIPQDSAVTLTEVSFEWSDGTEVFHDLNATFRTGRTGLIGANGTGKTTLLKLICGALTATSGSIQVTGRVGYLPQNLNLNTESTVAELLGIQQKLHALRAIESGEIHEGYFQTLGDSWDIEARARAVLDSIGLYDINLDRKVKSLSGGEAMLAALAGLQQDEHEIVLLDEPTNNLDREARQKLYDVITAWRGNLIVVSHDVMLLDLMDDTAELQAGSLTVFGGNYSAYQRYLAQEQSAAEQALRTAEQKVKVEKQQRAEAQIKLARRRRYAQTDFENKRKPKIVMNQRRTEAEVSAGKLRGMHDEKLEAAQLEAKEQAARIRRDLHIRINLPDPQVASRRQLAEFRNSDDSGFVMYGPERLALTGPNAMGKTRLLETLVIPSSAKKGLPYAIRHTDRIGYLPQRLSHLNNEASVFEAIRDATPDTPPEEVRENLARLLFRGDTIHQRIGTLSGGERFRVALARLLLSEPPHQLLVLDEPTNNLDLDSVNQLVDALSTYRGGLIVVSHDDAFLKRLNITTWLTLNADGLHARQPTGPKET